MKLKTVLSLIVLATLVVGCATPPKGATLVDDPEDLPTLQAVLADRLSQLKIRMSLAEFRRLMPEAYVGGQRRLRLLRGCEEPEIRDAG